MYSLVFRAQGLGLGIAGPMPITTWGRPQKRTRSQALTNLKTEYHTSNLEFLWIFLRLFSFLRWGCREVPARTGISGNPDKTLNSLSSDHKNIPNALWRKFRHILLKTKTLSVIFDRAQRWLRRIRSKCLFSCGVRRIRIWVSYPAPGVQVRAGT